jgi:RNase adaptor protein for sRNA GlmZ degradation
MCDNFPAEFLIDYVRVYQDTSQEDQTVGCSTRTHPTKTWIKVITPKIRNLQKKSNISPFFFFFFFLGASNNV